MRSRYGGLKKNSIVLKELSLPQWVMDMGIENMYYKSEQLNHMQIVHVLLRDVLGVTHVTHESQVE